MNPTRRDAVLVPHPDVFLREEGEEGGFLYDPNSGGVLLLNASAAAFWRLLDGRRTLREVIEVLEREFADFDESAASEVSQLADELVSRGLIGLPGPGPPT